VVLDTNILISACLKPAGLEARVTAMAVAGSLEACVTAEVMAEYREVLTREKFRKWRDEAAALLDSITQSAARVIAGPPLHDATDEDDNRFLECAAASNAEFLITGNRRHYPAESGMTKIVNARMFFDFTGTTPQTDSSGGSV